VPPVELIGLVASVITGTQVVRQAVDVFAVDRPDGVSWVTWWLAYVQSLGLLILSVDEELVAGTIINAWVGLLCVPIVVRVMDGSRRHALLRGGAFLALATVVLLVVTLVAGSGAAGAIGSVASAFVWIPQAIRSFRLRSGRGLSWTVVATGVVSSALWAVYAIGVHQWQLLVPPISAIAALAVTAVFALMKPVDKAPDPSATAPR
jgi:uncharacterized protein with PQ loop repeat